MSNKTSDKNVANIERLNNFANMTFLYGNRVNLNVSGLKEIQQDLKYLLAEREQKDKRIQELEEELEKANKQLDLDYVDENYIPKQVIIDKVNEINKKYEDSKDENGESPYFYPDFTIRILQKLLEGER